MPSLKLIGKIVPGAGKAAFFTEQAWVQNQCQKRLRFVPYPGTLNLEIVDEDLETLKRMRAADDIELVPPDPAFCCARVRPVSISNIPVALIIPPSDVNVHRPNIIEILAPVNLKKTLNLDDGDVVTVELD